MFAPRSFGLIAEGNFQDPHNARLLYLASGGLLLLGLALGIGTWLWWRSSKVEHPALGPLEVIGEALHVRHEHEHLMRVLQGHPRTQRPRQMPQVQPARRAVPRQHARPLPCSLPCSISYVRHAPPLHERHEKSRARTLNPGAARR